MTKKHGKYDKSFADTNYSFCAMVWETLGALNSEGEEVLRQIFRFAAKQLGCEFSSYCGRAWARISCCLQRSVAQSILNRIDGREFRDPLIVSGPDTLLTSADLLSVNPPPALAISRDPLPSPPLAPPPSAPSLLPSLPVQSPSPQPSPRSPPCTAEPSPIVSTVVPPKVSPARVPGFVAIKADGDCCYHLAGVVGKLCTDPRAVVDGYAACSKVSIAQARAKILENLEKLAQSKQEFFPSAEELEGHVTRLIGESSSTFISS